VLNITIGGDATRKKPSEVNLNEQNGVAKGTVGGGGSANSSALDLPAPAAVSMNTNK
jgi:hypothetical protein